MEENQKKINSQLPVRGFLIVFVILLMSVAFTAAIFGENQKVSITARRLMNYVAARDYEEAYELLTENAQQKMDIKQFKAAMAQLRMYLHAQYGPNFSQNYKFTSQKKFWLPWIDESRRSVSVGLYRKEPGVGNEIKELVSTPKLAGPELTDMLTIVRRGNRWMVDDINFNPEDYADILRKFIARDKELFTPTENGFALEGFVYNRRTAPAEDRALLIDAISQALVELQKDAGINPKDSGSMMDLIP